MPNSLSATTAPLIGLLAATSSLAQTTPVGRLPASTPPGVVRQLQSPALDKGFEDLDPLAESLLLMPVDLRVDSDFEEVRPVPGSTDLLMRQGGGLYATFPRSEYALSKNGISELIPAGTVFFIGSVPQVYLSHVRGNPMSVSPKEEHVAPARPATGTALSTIVEPVMATALQFIAPIGEAREAAQRVTLAHPEPMIAASTTGNADTGPAPTSSGTLPPPAFTLDHEAYRRHRLRGIAVRLSEDAAS